MKSPNYSRCLDPRLPLRKPKASRPHHLHAKAPPPAPAEFREVEPASGHFDPAEIEARIQKHLNGENLKQKNRRPL